MPKAREERAPPRRRVNYARWRVATLAGVYVLMVLHVVHWKLSGRTLAPLELNEVMYTLELGIVTAGFIFMAVAVLATLIFGRFFCSWGCHILALEDLAAWLLGRLGIHPKPVRSRVLKWVPLGAMLYMFVWPQVSRLWQGRPMPVLHLQTDAEGWASFTTNDFWRNLPGPGVAILTFLICGFVVVYLLGTRAFCTYACPYGAIFRIADRFAAGRIVAAGDCSQCGKCTAVCQSRVLVHRELMAYGRVMDPACLKDLDCVAACPEGSIRYGVARPAILTIGGGQRIARPPYDFSWREDVLMAVVFLATLIIFRGLYHTVPFLLTLALGGGFAYLTVLLCRLPRTARLRLNNLRLRHDGRLTWAGRAFVAASVAMLAFSGHSAVIRYHEINSDRLLAALARHDDGGASARGENMLAAISHLEFSEKWGLYQPLGQRQQLAQLHTDLGLLLADRGELPSAARHLARSTAVYPHHGPTRYNLGVILAALGRRDEAMEQYQKAVRLSPEDADVHNNLGLLLAHDGDMAAAEKHLAEAIRLRPDFAAAHFNLGRVGLTLGRWSDATLSLETAARLDPAYRPHVAELLAAVRNAGGGGQ